MEVDTINFLYILLGMIIIQAGIPIIDSIVSLILTFIEYLKGGISVQIAKLHEQLEPEIARAIGFDIQPEEENDEVL